MNRVFGLLLLLVLLTDTYGQSYEVTVNQQIGLRDASMLTSDLNIDGLLDLVVSGIDSEGAHITKVFSIDFNGNLSFVSSELSYLDIADFYFSDFNRDGFNDIVLSGALNGNPISSILINSGGNYSFADTGLNFELRGKARTADLNNDGYPDLLIAGDDNQDNLASKYIKQDVNGIQECDSCNFISGPEYKVLDWNGDNFDDIIISKGQVQKEIRVLQNDRTGNLLEVNNVLGRYVNPIISNGDVVPDGQMDLVIAGGRDGSYWIDLFRNNSGNPELVKSIETASAIEDLIVVDLTNDGILDAIVVVDSSVILYESIYQNTNSMLLLDSIRHASVAIGDFDRDFDQDLFVTGLKEGSLDFWVLQNNNGTNGRPNMPNIIDFIYAGDSLHITWNPTTDDSTPPSSISYRVVLREDDNLLAPTNWTVSDYGPQGLGTSHTFKDIPPGNYQAWIAPQDNSLITEFMFPIDDIITAMCDPGQCANYVVNQAISKCMGDSTPEMINAPGGLPVYWYSFEQDSLGLYSVLNFSTDVNDVVYANYTDQNGCTIHFSQSIVFTDPAVYDPDLIGSVSECKGDLLLEEDLINSETIGLIRNWTIQKNGIGKEPLEFPYVVRDNSLIFLELSDEIGCVFKDTIELKAINLPNIDAGEDVAVVLGESVRLEAKGGTDYVWDPPQGLSNANIPDPICTPTSQIIYTVTGTEGNCKNQDQIVVSIIKDVFVPNLFSPNNDGQNDTFKVYGRGLKELNLKILSVSGSILHDTSDINEITSTGWDGTSKGKLLPPGNYVWHISGTYLNGQKVSANGRKTGLVTLIR